MGLPGIHHPFWGCKGALTKLRYPNWVYCLVHNFCQIEMNILELGVKPLSSTWKLCLPKRAKNGHFGGVRVPYPNWGTLTRLIFSPKVASQEDEHFDIWS